MVLEGVIMNNYLLLCFGIAGKSGFDLRVIDTGDGCTCSTGSTTGVEEVAGMDILEKRLLFMV